MNDQPRAVHYGWVLLVFIIIAVLLGVLLSIATAIFNVRHERSLDSPMLLLQTGVTLVAAIGATVFTWLAFREPTGLYTTHPERHVTIGFALGALALTVAVVVPVLVGVSDLALAKQVPWRLGLLQLVTLAPAGIGEELLLRGLGFNALRRGIGDMAAVLVSSAIFGAMHLFNPHASVMAAALIALVGVWFGLLVVRAGSVWIGVGVHVAWNFFEGFVFGQPVSGNGPGSSVFVAAWPPVAGFWSGGDFGPEAAGFTAVVLLVAIAATWWWPTAPSGASRPPASS